MLVEIIVLILMENNTNATPMVSAGGGWWGLVGVGGLHLTCGVPMKREPTERMYWHNLKLNDNKQENMGATMPQLT